MKLTKGLQIAFLIVGTLVVLEFLFIQGMFTWLMAVAAIIVVGLLNVIINVKNKEWLQTLVYILATVALCMGYTELL